MIRNIDWPIVIPASFVVALVALTIWALIDEFSAEKFYLRKDQWHCTSSRVELVPINQSTPKGDVIITMIPNNVCDRWERNK